MTRLAVVTGAASGIGSATCQLLRNRDWTVVGLDKVTPPTPDSWRRVDVEDVDALSAALNDLGPVDGLVNNAGAQLFKPLVDTTVSEWDSIHAQNLRAAFVTMKLLYPRLAETRGSVVNVASVHAAATSRSVAAYAASKGGVVALTRAAALEFAPSAVRVNVVLPGAVDTPALSQGFSERAEAREELIARTPLQRIARPAEIAELIAFLLDDDRASFVTGQSFVADGGVLARLASE